MESSSPARGKRPLSSHNSLSPKHFRWTYEMESHFLDLLQAEERMGNRVGETFTPQAYRNILGELQATFGPAIQKHNLMNKIRTLKQNWSEFKDALKGMSDFSWNWETKKFEAEDEVWEALIQARPTAATLRNKSCPHWEKMNTLFASSRAVGMGVATFTEWCSQLDAENSSKSYDVPYASDHIPQRGTTPHATSRCPSVGPQLDEQVNQSQRRTPTSTSAGKTTGKRKSAGNSYDQECREELKSLRIDLSRAMVESATIMAGRVRREHPKSADVFEVLHELHLEQAYMLECYRHLCNNDAMAEQFLGARSDFKQALLDLIMNSR